MFLLADGQLVYSASISFLEELNGSRVISGISLDVQVFYKNVGPKKKKGFHYFYDETEFFIKDLYEVCIYYFSL